MQDFPIGLFLNEESLTYSMLITHSQIIVKSELNSGCSLPTLLNLPDRDTVPLILSPLLSQLHINAVEILIDRVCYYRLLPSQFLVHFQ